MIKFHNSENDVELELCITGYQFPMSPNDNWCLLKITVMHNGQSFEAEDPALETTEIVSLLNWFKRLSEHRLPKYGLLSFVEPCIEFEFISCKDKLVTISINLDYELKPDFNLTQFGSIYEHWNMRFDLNFNDFERIINELEVVLQKYPVRGKS